MTKRAAGVVLAGGSGTRVGSATNKVYLPLGGRPLLVWSFEAMGKVAEIGTLVLVARPVDAELVKGLPAMADVEVVPGGVTRQASELAALRHLAPRIRSGEIDTVLLHDGARPLVSPELITEVLRAAREYGGAIPGVPSEDVAELTPGGELVRSHGLVAVQTPQGFRAVPLLAAYEQAAREGFAGTDTASCMARFSTADVRSVPGDQRNFKITYQHDLVIAEQLAERPAGP